MPVLARVSHAVGRVVLPADTDLPKRHWRWLWAAGALRLFVVFPLGAVLIIPYSLARGLVAALDALGVRCGDFYATCHNRDMVKADWRPALKRAPAPVLGGQWKTRA